MPKRGSRFTAKEDRMAEHIAESEGGGEEGKRIGYATVNKRKKSLRKR